MPILSRILWVFAVLVLIVGVIAGVASDVDAIVTVGLIFGSVLSAILIIALAKIVELLDSIDVGLYLLYKQKNQTGIPMRPRNLNNNKKEN